jgi:hypothetical protein
MPIRNMWSLECGEVLTAEAVIENVKGVEVYFPLHDIGTDLLLMMGCNHISIQVKESRYFTSRVLKGTKGHSWHQIHKLKLEKEKVDFYVFLTYLPRFGEYKMSSFENKFLIVPATDLKEFAESKNSGKTGIYSFYFNFEGKRVVDKRDGVTDYSKYFEAWNLVGAALKRQE